MLLIMLLQENILFSQINDILIPRDSQSQSSTQLKTVIVLDDYQLMQDRHPRLYMPMLSRAFGEVRRWIVHPEVRSPLLRFTAVDFLHHDFRIFYLPSTSSTIAPMQDAPIVAGIS
jgi:hypothetical protein